MFNRNFTAILSANIVLGLPMSMLIVLGSLTGAQLTPVPAMATLPPAIQMIAAVVASTPMSLFMGRAGRRAGVFVSAGLTVVAGILAILAIQMQSFPLLCLAHFMFGVVFVGTNYLRFAAAEVVSEDRKAKAISFVMASGLIAAFIGPEIFVQTKDLLAPLDFAGAYAAISLIGLLGIMPVAMMPRMTMDRSATGASQSLGSRLSVLRRPTVIAAIGAAAMAHATMLLIMTPTPLAMVGCGFGEDLAADVIRWHVIAMFAPGLVTGSLIQRFGAAPVVGLGLVILLISAIFAYVGIELWNFYGSLTALGIGWSFGFIGATHLLQKALSPEERPLVQGINDTLLALAAAIASLASGALYAGLGWTAVALAAPPLVLAVPIAALLLGRRGRAAA